MAPTLKARANLYLLPVIAFDGLTEYGILFQPDFAIAAQLELFKMAATSVFARERGSMPDSATSWTAAQSTRE